MTRSSAIIKFVVSGVLLFLTSQSVAQISGNTCLAANGGGGCTAGDLAVSSVVVTKVIEGCVSPTDTALVDLTATINSASSQRYDAGIWINEDGTSALTGGSCYRDWLPVADGYTDFDSDGVCGSVLSGSSETRAMSGVSIACADLDGCLLYTSPSPRDA